MAFQLFFMAQCGAGKVYAEYNDNNLNVRAIVVDNTLGTKDLAVVAPFNPPGNPERFVIRVGEEQTFNLPGPARFDLESRPDDGLSTPDSYRYSASLEPV